MRTGAVSKLRGGGGTLARVPRASTGGNLTYLATLAEANGRGAVSDVDRVALVVPALVAARRSLRHARADPPANRRG